MRFSKKNLWIQLRLTILFEHHLKPLIYRLSLHSFRHNISYPFIFYKFIPNTKQVYAYFSDSLTYLLPSLRSYSVWQNFDFKIGKNKMEKDSYELRVYESVDDKSLYLIIYFYHVTNVDIIKNNQEKCVKFDLLMHLPNHVRYTH